MFKQNFSHNLHQMENTKYILIFKISIAFIMIIFLSYFSLKSNCKVDETSTVVQEEEEVIIKPKINKFLEYPNICYDVQIFTLVEEKVEKKNVTPEVPIENLEVLDEVGDKPKIKKTDGDDERPKIIAYIVVAILLVSAVKAVIDVLKVGLVIFIKLKITYLLNKLIDR